MNNQQSST